MITSANFLELCQIFKVPTGGGDPGSVTQRQVQTSAFNSAPSMGVNDAFIVNLTPAVTTLTNALLVSMTTGSLQNLTTTPTLKINALSPVTITLSSGVALAPGDITINSDYLFIYDLMSNTFQLINPSLSTANTFLSQGNSYNSAVDTGAANAYSVTLDPVYDESFITGFPIYVQIGTGNTNTSNSTISVNGTVKSIYLFNGNQVPAGMLIAGNVYYLLYSSHYAGFIVINPSPIQTYVTLSSQSTSLPNSFSLGSLGSGILQNSVSGGVSTLSALSLPLSLANGGTQANITASNGGIFYSNDTTGALLSGTTTARQLLLSGASTTPVWSTSTYPTTNAINTLLYASAANVMSALATANNGLLVTSGAGVPSISNAIGADITVNGIKIGLGGGAVSTNTALGFFALNSNTSGANNVAVGYESMFSNITGSTNIGIGVVSLFNNTGSNNIAIGHSSMHSATTGGGNIAIGQSALNSCSGSNNIAMGTDTLASLTSGNTNIVLGNASAESLTGSSNIILGNNTGSGTLSGISLGATSNCIIIGNFLDGTSAVMTGCIGIGYNTTLDPSGGSTSGTNGPTITIGSSANKVGFRGDGSIYPGATGTGSWRVKINGTYYLLPLMTDATQSLGSIITSPAASAASTLSLGTAYQNVLGYDVILIVYVAVATATTASILSGVGPTSTPTQQTIVSSLTLAGLNVIPITVYLPNNYYALISTSGTISASISGQQVTPV